MRITHVLLSTLLAVALAQQNIKDPIADFCRRHRHQTCVIDGKLYIDGGMVYYGGSKDNDSVAEQNTWLIWEDTQDVANGLAFPAQRANLTKDATIPSVSGGTLWPDPPNHLFYLFGGAHASPAAARAASPHLYFYDTIYNTWNRSASDASQARIAWPAFGAGAVTDTGVAYYYGGYLTERSDAGWRGDDLMLNGLLSYDMGTRRWGNSTWDQTRRAEGSLLYVPASEGGMLVYFGGVEMERVGGEVVYANMRQIHLFDLANSRWYTQTATGDVPKARRGFCAGVVWAKDYSSYNIYLFGGLGSDGAGLGDLYVLSLPSFQWTLVWPTPQWATFPGGRGWSSCDVFNGNQMLIIGGDFTNSSISDCDVPKIGGQHALLLGQENVELGAWWHAPLNNITGYRVPDQIVKKIGGDADGHATATAPVKGWDDEARDLAVYLKTSFIARERTATRAIPVSTSSSPATSQPTSDSTAKGSNAGAIAGGTVGGVVALASMIALVLFCLRRRKRIQNGVDAAATSNVNSPATAQGSTGISPLSRNSTLHSAFSQPSPYSPQGSPPPPSTPWHGISSSYYRDTYSPPPSYAQPGGYGPPQTLYLPPPGRVQSFKEHDTYATPAELPSAEAPVNAELPGVSSPVNAGLPHRRNSSAAREAEWF
ncbi:hypothetical protein P171DRAFT_481540 [Karstenula rhodostoma CBS 690.94]|uniref:Galactose oxidase n=1 Tax=Karstenula rhodostoma CBS 690.94 TaxID=1392251 RepID=A0A9P4PSK1_9PLEO|nr:hypothetical protein P171DRAFT_481540 [Karstenula rhodostoma CBS 690.94]